MICSRTSTFFLPLDSATERKVLKNEAPSIDLPALPTEVNPSETPGAGVPAFDGVAEIGASFSKASGFSLNDSTNVLLSRTAFLTLCLTVLKAFETLAFNFFLSC